MKRIQKKSAHKYSSWKILEWGIFQIQASLTVMHFTWRFYFTILVSCISLFFSLLCKIAKRQCLSVYLHWPTQLPMDGFSWNLKFDYFFKICQKFKFDWSLTRIMDTLHDDFCKFVIMSIWILLWMRNISDKLQRKLNRTFLFSNFFWKSCHLRDIVEDSQTIYYNASALHTG